MALVSPSILAADFANLQRDVEVIRQSGADYVHVDVMDGFFVPNISIGLPVVQALRRVTDLPLDVHLMIDKPIRYVERFCKAGADLLTIHVEADAPEQTLAALELIRAMGVKPAISLKPSTPVEVARPYLELCDMILVMTVEPGFGGQKFMADLLPKLRTLRTWLDQVNPGCKLEVDGGINLNTARLCTNSGAEVLVTGSGFFKAEDRSAFIAELQAL